MIEHWLKYAGAFENAIDDGDWQAVSKAFHPEATYERFSDDSRLVTPLISGPQGIVDNFENSVRIFDRRFISRRIRNITLASTDYSISHQFRNTYHCKGLLSFELIGSEEYLFSDDGLILSLQESFAPGIGTKLVDWLMQHSDNLKPLG